MPAGRPRLVAALLVALALTAACTAGARQRGPTRGAEHLAGRARRPAAQPDRHPGHRPRPRWSSPCTPPGRRSTSRSPRSSRCRTARWPAGPSWTPAPVRCGPGPPAEVRADRDVVAVVPASEVAPPLTVATVDGVDPLRDPSAYAVTTDGPEPPAVTTVTVTGDVMLGRRVGQRLAQVDDPAAALRPMARRLAGADLTIGNLESTLSRAGAPQQGGDSFAASPAVRAGLRAGRLRRAVAGEQPHRRLRAAGAGRDRAAGAGRRLRAGRRGRRPRTGFPSSDRRTQRRPVRRGGLRRDRRDSGRTAGAPGCAAGANGSAHRAAGAG